MVESPETGSRPISFQRPTNNAYLEIKLPCGQCIGCRLERSREWAVRCVNEAQLYQHNCFITLTYSNFHNDKLHTLVPRDYVLFMKRLRKEKGPGVRFFHCGEYGERFGRPHHHACLFNCQFTDKKLWRTINGVPLYTSDQLSRLWTDPDTGVVFGYSSIGDVTFESAAYVARYVTKKITGKKAPGHYGDRLPEYVTMSRRPGIGKEWLEKYVWDVYPADKVVARPGFACTPPRYYDNLFDDMDTDTLRAVKCERRTRAKEFEEENDYRRLEVKEQVQMAKVERLHRSYEKGLS